MDSHMDLRFLFSTKGEEGRGEEGTGKKEKKKGRRKRRSGRCSWPPEAPKRQGAPGRRRSANQPKRVSRLKRQIPREKKREKESQKTRPKRQEGGRSKKEERTPMNAARSVLNGRNLTRQNWFDMVLGIPVETQFGISCGKT